MAKIILFLRTCFLYLCAGIAILVLGPILAILLLLTPEKKRWNSALIFGTLRLLFTALVRGAWIQLTIIRESDSPVSAESYAEAQPPSAAAVWIANHQSAFDIPLMGYLQQGHPHFWFFWAKLLTTPVLGFFVRRLGVSVSQRDSRHDAHSLMQAILLLKEYRVNALIFPEGGRFTDGKTRQFSRGYLVLARKAGVPIIPVYIAGVDRVYPPYSFFIYPGSITITIGKPITLSEDQSDEQVTEHVRAWYQNHES